MAVDKLVDSTQLDADLTSVANAIRTKGGTSAQLAFPAGFVQAIGDIETGGGGADLDWIASASPTPSVRNFFNALKTGNYEHGEVTFSNVSNSWFDFFTLQSLTTLQGFIIIDKAFYQGDTSLSSVGSTQAINFFWADKSFINPTSETDPLRYGVLEKTAIQSNNNIQQNFGGNFIMLDGSAGMVNGTYKFENGVMQTKASYNNNNQYTNLLRNRTYIWIAY